MKIEKKSQGGKVQQFYPIWVKKKKKSQGISQAFLIQLGPKVEKSEGVQTCIRSMFFSTMDIIGIQAELRQAEAKLYSFFVDVYTERYNELLRINCIIYLSM